MPKKITQILLKKWFLAILLLTLIFSIAVQPTLAQPTSGIDLSQPSKTPVLGQRQLQIVEVAGQAVLWLERLLILLIIADAGIFFLGTWRWLKANGKKDKILDAKKTFAVGTVALTILLIAYAIVALVVEKTIASF